MKKLNTYIFEKLRINKNTSIKKVVPEFDEFWNLLKQVKELKMEDIYSDKDNYPKNEYGEKIFWMQTLKIHDKDNTYELIPTIDYKFYTTRFGLRGWAENNDLNYKKFDDKYKIELYNYMLKKLNDKS